MAVIGVHCKITKRECSYCIILPLIDHEDWTHPCRLTFCSLILFDTHEVFFCLQSRLKCVNKCVNKLILLQIRLAWWKSLHLEFFLFLVGRKNERWYGCYHNNHIIRMKLFLVLYVLTTLEYLHRAPIIRYCRQPTECSCCLVCFTHLRSLCKVPNCPLLLNLAINECMVPNSGAVCAESNASGAIHNIAITGQFIILVT